MVNLPDGITKVNLSEAPPEIQSAGRRFKLICIEEYEIGKNAYSLEKIFELIKDGIKFRILKKS